MTERRQIYTPPGGPPSDISPSPEIYAIMGEDAIYQMVEDFYLELGKSSIAHLFPADVVAASRRSAAFFVFILGGPPLYQQLYGSPRMRQRHLPFAIDEAARRVWLSCFWTILEHAEEKYHFPSAHKAGFVRFLEQFSAWMVNSQGGERGA